ncbi:MAG: N-acetylmuramoyl-L-alanine amidase [Patescibacteria group bacterium]|nr:N-acetylmuramoyl-L-alanine amidase [Patescibacteria group bacterium]
MSRFFIFFSIGVIVVATSVALYSLYIPYNDIINVPEVSSLPKHKKVKILIVPGHDLLDAGTSYAGINEGLLTRKLAGYLFDILNIDNSFDVKITRDAETGYYFPDFETYFLEQKTAIEEFRNSVKEEMKEKIKNGNVEVNEPIVSHSTSIRMSNILYGINKWSNENDIDLVLHIHFNNYPRSQMSKIGTYSGYSIYVPEHQYRNATSSLLIAYSIENQLKIFLKPSNLPIERNIIIESQDLIAIGANNSRDKASVLIEYGYIYESEISKDETLQKMAGFTYNGIKNYFSGE